MEIVPFSGKHLDPAAELLAARQRALRLREPVLPARFEDPAVVRPLIERELGNPGAAGVAALRDGRMTRYLIASVALPSPTSMWALFIRPRSVSIGFAGHAVAPEHGYDAYRAMYAVLAPRWNALGCFAHYVYLPARDETAARAWFSLGFGQDIAAVVRDTGPVAGQGAAGLELHQAGPEDLDVVMRLVQTLYRYHAGPPIFFPYLPETEGDQRHFQQELLDNPANAHWIAYRDGRALGIQTFTPPMIAEMIRPERSIYLFQGYTEPDARGGGVGRALLNRSMAWAREAGYDYCTLNYMTANLPGARFWLSHGFRPIEYRLCRRTDERIAWADLRTTEQTGARPGA